MLSTAIKLFEFGAEGGGAAVYRLPSNEVIERGSSGGMLDEEEDPIRHWEEKFPNWEFWWSNFKREHGEHWIFFYPIFIHEDIRSSIKESIDHYDSPDESSHYHKNNWLHQLKEA
jgi:hypothetical protein